MSSPDDVTESSIVTGKNIVGERETGGDIVTPGQGFVSGNLYDNQRTFGSQIMDSERLFASQREPILKWLVSYVASDIFDQGFRVYEVGNEEDDTLDDLVQAALQTLKAKKNLTRLTVFERRWGTSVLLCAYSTNADKVDWKTPLYDDKGKVIGDGQLLQITPYPKNSIVVKEEIKDRTSLLYGQPKFYEITQGATTTPLKVHHSRVIHDAPRLDEHPYWGLSVMDPIWDDSTGWRNIRWAMYQMLWRYGMGYPHFSFEGATQKEIDAWIAGGGLTDFFVRGIFTSNEKATVKFVGLEGITVQPKEYKEMVYDSLATGTRISQDILKGVSAGAVTGSETNLKEYAKLISNEQSDIEDVPMQLIRRLMETGQIDFDYEKKAFAMTWNSAFELSEIDDARVQLQTSMAYKNLTEILTINEVRVRAGEKDLKEGGELVLGIEKLKAHQFPTSPITPDPTPKPEDLPVELPPEPEEEESEE